MAGAFEPTSEAIEIRVPCRAQYVRTVRRAVADFAESFDLPATAVEAIEVAASEAVANIIRHAYPNAQKLPPVRVKCVHRGDGVTIEVADRGQGFAAPPAGVVPEIDLDREGGLGIILMKRLMDRVSFISKPEVGTRIRMTKRARNGLARLASTRGG